MAQSLNSALHAANHILANIGPATLGEIQTYLELIELPFGKVLHEPGDTIRYVYFPHGAVLSLLAVLSDGSTTEMATTGREGVLGVVEALGDAVAHGRCIVQFPGSVSRMRVEHLRKELGDNPHFRATMFRYLQFLFTQALQIGVCTAVHPVEARCCRMILTMRDRTGSDDLPLTHEFLAEMLGVRRPAISLATGHLQAAGLIRQGRGIISITDGTRLEQAACECYRTLRRAFERLLPHAPTRD